MANLNRISPTQPLRDTARANRFYGNQLGNIPGYGTPSLRNSGSKGDDSDSDAFTPEVDWTHKFPNTERPTAMPPLTPAEQQAAIAMSLKPERVNPLATVKPAAPVIPPTPEAIPGTSVTQTLPGGHGSVGIRYPAPGATAQTPPPQIPGSPPLVPNRGTQPNVILKPTSDQLAAFRTQHGGAFDPKSVVDRIKLHRIVSTSPAASPATVAAPVTPPAPAAEPPPQQPPASAATTDTTPHVDITNPTAIGTQIKRPDPLAALHAELDEAMRQRDSVSDGIIDNLDKTMHETSGIKPLIPNFLTGAQPDVRLKYAQDANKRLDRIDKHIDDIRARRQALLHISPY